MSGPFKMKGSPMQRNFGVAPLKHSVRKQVAATQTEKSKIIDVEHTHSKEEEEKLKKGELPSQTIKIRK